MSPHPEPAPTYAKIMSPKAVVVHFQDGRSFHWPSTHPQFAAATDLLRGMPTDAEVVQLMDVSAAIVKAVAGQGDIIVTRDGVLYKGKPVHMTITERILSFHAEGADIGYLVAFMENLFKNPNRDSVLSVYDFLEANQVPITPDGCFLAYKKVDKDYLDYHSHSFDNSVGKVCRVEGWEVDPDRTNTCSKGLHVCSREYLPHYYGGMGHVMICKVNPAHVYAVPKDYNNAKMRVTEYTVVGELTDEQKANIFDTMRTVVPGVKTDGIDWDEKLINDAVDSELADYPEDGSAPDHDCPYGESKDACCEDYAGCGERYDEEDAEHRY